MTVRWRGFWKIIGPYDGSGHGGPVALAVKRFTPETMAEAEGEFLDSVKYHRTADGSYRIPGEFVTVIGYR